MKKVLFYLLLLIFSGCNSVDKTSKKPTYIDLSLFGDGIHHWGLENNYDYPRYDSSQYLAIADNLISFQNIDGGWPKNIDWLSSLPHDSIWDKIPEFRRYSTFDNRNIYPQIEYLSRVYTITEDQKYKIATEHALEYVLKTQHTSGGWRGADVDAITFNDDVMTGIMNMLLDIKNDIPHYKWIKSKIRNKLSASLDQAIDATLKCQIVVNKNKTAWCQQHDHLTFLPTKARSYELPSITAGESVKVARFLMRIQNPSKEIIQAIESAATWFEEVKINGLAMEIVKVENDTAFGVIKKDRIITQDSIAKPLWARYYEIDTFEPFLCRRSGEKVYDIKDIEPDRRVGYAWYGYWPEEFLKEDYPEWKKKKNSL